MPTPSQPPLDLPPALTLGVATSSYQIEGATAEDGRSPSIWDTFAARPGATVAGGTGETACDHYHRLEEDLDLLAWLGVDSYRFSVAWPRVVPDGKRTEPRGLDFYDRLVDGLLERGIRHLATLYHWDLPQVLEDAGGWSARDTVERFVHYTEVTVTRLGDRVRDWSTLNEPWCSAFLGYDLGIHAPGVRDPKRAIAAVHHLLLAHGEGARCASELLGPGGEVGIVLNLAPVRPITEHDQDVAAARLADGLRNRVWLGPLFDGRYPDDVLEAWAPLTDLEALHRDGDLDRIAAPIDLLGVNYYNPVVAGDARRHAGGTPPGPGQDGVAEVAGPPPHTTLGWSVDPTGLAELLARLHRDAPGTPLAVTENGGAFPDAATADGTVDDADRIAYLDGHLRAVAAAIEDGVDVRGYYVWTLLDNFEWAEGYVPTFGIVHVDRSTQRRTPKASAHWYRDLLRSPKGARRSPRHDRRARPSNRSPSSPACRARR